MTDDDVLVRVYSGPYAEVLFLKTLIESAGIETSFSDVPQRGVGFEPVLFVRRADAEHANELIADFEKNGRRAADQCSGFVARVGRRATTRLAPRRTEGRGQTAPRPRLLGREIVSAPTLPMPARVVANQCSGAGL